MAFFNQVSGGQFLNQNPITGDKLSTLAVSGSGDGLFTVTQTGQNQLTDNYTIYGNADAPGTVYRIYASGSGTQATTAAIVPNWYLLAYGQNNLMNTQIAASQFTAGSAFFWSYEAYILITAVGATGSILAWGRVGVDTNGASLVNGFCAQALGATSVDTTTKWFLGVEFGWAATTNSPSISSQTSIMQRMVYY